MLPRDWSAFKVSDICTFQNGHGFGPEDWKEQGLPIIRIQNLNGGTKFDYFSGVPEQKWLVHPGQMLFAWAGTRGVSFGPTIWRGPIGVLNQHIFKVTPKAGVHENWLYWALRHVTDRIERSAHGFKDTLVHVKKSDIDKQPVLVPPIEEQKRISAAIETWDSAIAITERLLANSRKQFNFVRRALIFGSGASSKWREAKIGALIRENNRRIDWDDNCRYSLISIRRRSEGAVLRESLFGHEILTKKLKLVRAGDFVISKMQVVHGAMASIPAELDGMYASDSYLVYESEAADILDIRFLAWLSTTPEFRRLAYRCSHGVHIEKMTFDVNSFLSERVRIPFSLEEQKRICAILDKAAEIPQLLTKHLAKLREEKIAVMQQLLTGKRRFHLPLQAKERRK